MVEHVTPESLEAEQSTLGAMIIERVAVSRAGAVLVADDFNRELHKKIFVALIALFDAGKSIDYVTLAQELRDRGQLDDVGGSSYILALIDVCPSAMNVAEYVRVVKEKSDLRKLLAAAEKVKGLCYGDGLSVPEIKAQAEQTMLEASHSRDAGECFSTAQVAAVVATTLESQIRSGGRLVGIPTGFEALDRKMGGWRENHLVILGARPSLGKSALALMMAYHVAKQGYPALIFGFEMAKEELTQRLACSLAMVDSQSVELGLVSDEEIERFVAALKEISELPLYIQDTPEMTTYDMRSRARRVYSEHGKMGLIVVDYLQIIAHASQDNGGNLAQALGRMARECHIMGGECGCTTLALSQLSRKVEERDNKRPQLSDLRDSGGLEAEANRTLLLYRDSYYRRREYEGKPESEKPSDDGIAELNVAKNRGGRIGTVRLGWTGAYTRFDDWRGNAEYQHVTGGGAAPVYADSRWTQQP